MGTSPTQITVSPLTPGFSIATAHFIAWSPILSTPGSTEDGGCQPQGPSSTHTCLPGVANPSLHKGWSRPGWHAVCLLLSALTLYGKMKHPEKTPNDRQRDLNGLTGNRKIQKPENRVKDEDVKRQMGGRIHKML